MSYEKRTWRADPNGLRRWIKALGINKGDTITLPQTVVEWSACEIGNIYSQDPKDIEAVYRGVGNSEGGILFETPDSPGVIQREGMSEFYGWRQFSTIQPRTGDPAAEKVK